MLFRSMDPEENLPLFRNYIEKYPTVEEWSKTKTEIKAPSLDKWIKLKSDSKEKYFRQSGLKKRVPRILITENSAGKTSTNEVSASNFVSESKIENTTPSGSLPTLRRSSTNLKFRLSNLTPQNLNTTANPTTPSKSGRVLMPVMEAFFPDPEAYKKISLYRIPTPSAGRYRQPVDIASRIPPVSHLSSRPSRGGDNG